MDDGIVDLESRRHILLTIGRIVLRELKQKPWPADREEALQAMHDIISEALTEEEFEDILEGCNYVFVSGVYPPEERPAIAEASPGAEPLRTIDELLQALRENMPSAVFRGEDGRVFVAVIDPERGWPLRRVAFVAKGSPPVELLARAQEADRQKDTRAYYELPLRYGPGFNEWVLPFAPYAPKQPEALDVVPF